MSRCLSLQAWDVKEAIQASAKRATVATYVRDTLEAGSCSRWDPLRCDTLWTRKATSKFFVAHVENMDLVIEHSFDSNLVRYMFML